MFSLRLFFVGLKQLVDFLPQLRSCDVSEVVWPRSFEHLLKCQCRNAKESANTCVGVGNDRAALAPLLFPFHHDVAIYGIGLL